VNGILFNHESPRRGETFVTRKITRAAVRIAAGEQEKLFLGNLNAKRDWGHAQDYVKGMYLMLQQKEPEDFVLATGETHTVRSFCEKAFRHAGIKLEWRGEGVNEQGVNSENGDILVEVDPQYFRPTEVDLLIGDPSKAKTKLGWDYDYSFDELVEDMVKSDADEIKLNLESV
jgi:GDPmannose 4,6-dehydratase